MTSKTIKKEKKWFIIGYNDDKKGPKDEIVYDFPPDGFNYNGRRLGTIGTKHNTKEELIEKCGVLKEPCKICGGVIKTTYYNNDSLINNNMCFTCDHWENIYQKYKIANNGFIIDGGFYSDGGRKSSNYTGFLGFGGREFKIEKDGKVTSTNNLWYSGTIPPEFRDKLVDNAKFI